MTLVSDYVEDQNISHFSPQILIIPNDFPKGFSKKENSDATDTAQSKFESQYFNHCHLLGSLLITFKAITDHLFCAR